MPKLRDGDNEKPGYRHSWRLFVHVADRLGVDVSLADKQSWRSMLGITRGLDDLVDDAGVTDLRPHMEALMRGEAVGNITALEAKNFKASIELQTEDRQAYLLGNDGVIKLADYAVLRSQAKRVAELIAINKSEAEWFATLLEIKTKDQTDDLNRQIFNEWLKSYFVSGYLFDTVTDMGEDFENDNILVLPTFCNRFKVAKVALREIIRGVRRTPTQSLGRVAYVAYRNERPATKAST